MPKKKPNLVKVPWSKFSDAFLKSIKDLNSHDNWNEIESAILKETRKTLNLPKCSIKLTKKSFRHTLSDKGLKRKLTPNIPNNLWTRLSEEEKEAFKKIYPAGTSDEVKASINKTYPNADRDTIFNLARFAGLKGQRKLRG